MFKEFVTNGFPTKWLNKWKGHLLNKFNSYSADELKLRLNHSGQRFLTTVLSFTGIITSISFGIITILWTMPGNLTIFEVVRHAISLTIDVLEVYILIILGIFIMTISIIAYLSYRRSIMFIVFRKKTTDIKN